jgi:hypothetical protein
MLDLSPAVLLTVALGSAVRATFWAKFQSLENTMSRNRREGTLRKNELELANRIKQAYQRSIASTNQAIADIVECGRLFLEAKREVGHGNWLPLLEQAGISEDRAERYMKIAKVHDEDPANSAALRNLSQSQALAWISETHRAAKQIPQEHRATAIEITLENQERSEQVVGLGGVGLWLRQRELRFQQQEQEQSEPAQEQEAEFEPAELGEPQLREFDAGGAFKETQREMEERMVEVMRLQFHHWIREVDKMLVNKPATIETLKTTKKLRQEALDLIERLKQL